MSLGIRRVAAVEALRSTYWLLPSVLTAVAVGLSVLLVGIDRGTDQLPWWLGWSYGGGADGARSLLSAVAGSMITVVSVTFSVTVVALTVSSQHFGPRLLRSFMHDRPAQLVLGTFTGTFAYCLMVLRTVQGDGAARYSAFVPHLAVTGAVALALASVGVLIYYVHHIAVSTQVAEITGRITHELEAAIDRLYPDPIGEGVDPAARVPRPPPPDACGATARASGYVQAIDSEAVLQAAARYQTSIWLTARPGDFVLRGDRVAAIHPAPEDTKQCAATVASAVGIGTERTSQQDAAFAIQQLVEIALRALAPGVNEPYTAITVIDQLRQGLSKLAMRRIPHAVRTGRSSTACVVAPAQTFAALVAEAFEPVALHAGDNVAVVTHLFDAIEHLAGVVRRHEDRRSLRRLTAVLWAAAAVRIEHEPVRTDVAASYERVRRALGSRRSHAAPKEADVSSAESTGSELGV